MLKRLTLLILVVSMLLTLAPAMAEIQYPLGNTDVELDHLDADQLQRHQQDQAATQC